MSRFNALPLSRDLEGQDRNLVAYAFALELGYYRAALRECIRALRRVRHRADSSEYEHWLFRFRGTWTRRGR